MTPVTRYPFDSPTHVFVHRVLDAIGVALICAWWTAFGIVFIGFCLTAAR